MSHPPETTATAPSPGRRRTARRRAVAAVAIGLVALLSFGFDLKGEPHFVDESAIVSKSYFLALAIRGARHDAAWLEYPAFDHPPLGQYLTGLGLIAGGFRFPERGVIWRWYNDTRVRGETDEALVAARWPSVILGAVGCVAIYALGVLARDGRTGALAALLLMVNPLYRLHARRAIADVPCEALSLAALAVGLYCWREVLAGRRGIVRGLLGAVATGCLTGLAVLGKLNGVLVVMTLGAWAALAIALPRFAIGRRLAVAAGSAMAAIAAFGVFVALNPAMTAHPKGPLPPHLAPMRDQGVWERTKMYWGHRVNVSDLARKTFPHNALYTPLEKLEEVAVQGFGRFGPFGPHASDSTRRFDWRQDWGAVIWGPWVALGLVWAAAPEATRVQPATIGR
jgi:hypothetical protein